MRLIGMNRFMLFVVSFIFLCKGNSQNQLKTFIDSLQHQTFYKNAELGLSVRDVLSGDILASHRDLKLMIPASGLKVITTLCAYDVLGKNYTFDTGVYYQGKINDQGVLFGDIIVFGSGDPTLGSSEISGCPGLDERLSEIELALRKLGIQKIEGEIIADVSLFSSLPVPPSWQYNDIGNYYGGGAWAVNVVENEYSIFFNREKDLGEKADIVYVEPFIPELELENHVSVDSAGSGDNVYIFGGPGEYNKTVLGTVPAGKGLFSVKGAIPDPPLYFVYRIFQKCKQSGILVRGYKVAKEPILKDSLSGITTLHSPPLYKIIKEANSKSINLYSEAILQILGKGKGNTISRTNGINKINEYLEISGLSEKVLHMEDGSGLSARNLISADLFTAFMVHIIKKYGEQQILSLMPRAGLDGTVKKLLSGSTIQTDVWAKSGSMNSIQSYTGFIRTRKGKLVAFSLMINGSTAKKAKNNRAEAEKIIAEIHKYL
ncbi:MAG: D-alanyl-D-alanine carboxypeptidase/D-alanyl-D-alanine-endopeptidase [Saprospiraceae bacterium]|nr:D-alanyl-D-alanine carboxypeptidase/D-alanyl-D-alanine-endopeptidase [Saprospiraceae bacterium]